jgi:hypothetical protein
MHPESDVALATTALFLLASLTGLVVCLAYQRLSPRLIVAAGGFGGEVLAWAFSHAGNSFLWTYSASSSVDPWIVLGLFRAVCACLVVLGLSLAFADITARLRRMHREDEERAARSDRPERRSLPAQEDLAPWRPTREDDRDIQR